MQLAGPTLNEVVIVGIWFLTWALILKKFFSGWWPWLVVISVIASAFGAVLVLVN